MLLPGGGFVNYVCRESVTDGVVRCWDSGAIYEVLCQTLMRSADAWTRGAPRGFLSGLGAREDVRAMDASTLIWF